MGCGIVGPSLGHCEGWLELLLDGGGVVGYIRVDEGAGRGLLCHELEPNVQLSGQQSLLKF